MIVSYASVRVFKMCTDKDLWLVFVFSFVSLPKSIHRWIWMHIFEMDSFDPLSYSMHVNEFNHDWQLNWIVVYCFVTQHVDGINGVQYVIQHRNISCKFHRLYSNWWARVHTDSTEYGCNTLGRFWISFCVCVRIYMDFEPWFIVLCPAGECVP